MDEPDAWCEVTTLGDLLVRAAHLAPDHAALIFPDSRASFRELLSRARDIAGGLLALGIVPGDNVGILENNSIDLVAALFGIALAGATAVPLNTRYKAKELAYVMTNARLRVLLTTADPGAYVEFTAEIGAALPSLAATADPVALALPEAPDLVALVLLRGECAGFVGAEQFRCLARGIEAGLVEATRRAVRLRDIALIIYTSGTTANPKGCLLSHEAVTRGPSERARGRLATGPRDVSWSGGPLFHIATLAPFIGSVSALGTFLSDGFFEPGRALALMEANRATVAWAWFPAIIQSLLNHPQFSRGRLASLGKLIMIGPAGLMERLQDMFNGVELLQACGMTETAGIFALSDRDETLRQRATTQGRAAPGVSVRIVDPDSGEDLRDDGVGEILVRGYNVMDGYFGDPVKTASALSADGWLRTGDLYRRLDDGSLIFCGRQKDMLKVGGENVAAIEIEAFLCEHPSVKLAEVVGRPDPRLDEVPVAFVELQPGSVIAEEELIAFCRGRIASFKVPREVYIIQSQDWPMSATKVDKRALRERLRVYAPSGL